jgi:hypothetical protein
LVSIIRAKGAQGELVAKHLAVAYPRLGGPFERLAEILEVIRADVQAKDFL